MDGTGGGGDDRPNAKGRSLEAQQARFMLWKQWIQKRRGWPQTLIEVLSPVLIMCALVYAHHLTRVQTYTQYVYAGDLHRLANDVSSTLVRSLEDSHMINCAAEGVADLNAHLPPLDLTPQAQQQYQEYMDQVDAAASLGLIQQGYPWQGQGVNGTGPDGDGPPGQEDIPVPAELREAVKQAAQVFVDAATQTLSNDELRGQLSTCAQKGSAVLARSLVEAYMAAINNKGPQPVFTLDEYLLLSRTLKATMNSNPQVAEMLYSFKRDFGWNWLGNLVGTGKLAFTPDTPQVRALVQSLSDTHLYFRDQFEGILPRDQIEAMAAEGHNFWAVVDFAYGPEPGGSADYTIRMSLLETPETWVTIDKFGRHTSKRYKMYFVSGFFSIEAAINAYVLGINATLEGSLVVPQSARWNVTWNVPPDLSSTVRQQPYALWACPFPKPSFTFNGFYQAVGPMLGLVMVLSMVFPLAMLIRGMVEEKETRLREVLCIMGLRPYVLQLSWLIAYATVFLLVCILSVLVTGLTFLSSTSWSLLFTYMMVFCISELAFGVMVSTLFNKAKVSAVVGPLLHFAIVMPRYAFFKTAPGQAIGAKLAVSLLAPSAFTFGMDLIAQYEGAGSGMTWADLWSDPYPLGATLWMMVLDCALYLALASYFDKVIPSGYGPTLPATFPCRPYYWRGCLAWCRSHWPFATSRPGSSPYTAQEGTPLLAVPAAAGGPREDQPTPLGMGAGTAGDGSAPLVDIRNLHMKYPNGVTAVKDLSLQMHAGQITALLGHNGAGKSTTVAMMTGLIMPTSGDCIIAGHSVVHDTRAARQSLGLCPQHEVLVGRFTVREHLILLAAIKGVQGWERCVAAAHAMRAFVGLTPADEGAMASALSGGMKRKLQMGMALIGGSQVVVADEPTSGMDPTARRGLWALLRTVRQERRAVLLTTHYMDEADILGDNVVIMAGGQLRAQGSGLALKDAHGGAYTLSLTFIMPTATPTTAHTQPAPATNGHNGSTNGHSVTHGDANGYSNGYNACKGDGGSGREDAGEVLLEFMSRACVLVERLVPGVELVRRAGTELALQLPAAFSDRFPTLLEALEKKRVPLGIAHVSISMPSLEEVFLAVTAVSDARSTIGRVSAGNNTASPPPASMAASRASSMQRPPAIASAFDAVPHSGAAQPLSWAAAPPPPPAPAPPPPAPPTADLLGNDDSGDQQQRILGLLDDLLLEVESEGHHTSSQSANLPQMDKQQQQQQPVSGLMDDFGLRVDNGSDGHRIPSQAISLLQEPLHQSMTPLAEDSTLGGNGSGGLNGLGPTPFSTDSVLQPEIGNRQSHSLTGVPDFTSVLSHRQSSTISPTELPSLVPTPSTLQVSQVTHASPSIMVPPSLGGNHLGKSDSSIADGVQFDWNAGTGMQGNGDGGDGGEERGEESTAARLRWAARLTGHVTEEAAALPPMPPPGNKLNGSLQEETDHHAADHMAGVVSPRDAFSEGIGKRGGRGKGASWWGGREEPHAWRCFKLMLGKRAAMAGRDWKGLLYLFLLPVIAVAMTLTVLLLNLDPSGPSLVLSLRSMEQYTPVVMVHNPAPGILTGCLGPTDPLPAVTHDRSKTVFEGWVPKTWYNGPSTCPYGLPLQDLGNVSSSYTLSEWLLEQQVHNNTLQPPQYAALMWSDPVVLRAPVEFSLAAGVAKRAISADFAGLGVETSNVEAYLELLTTVPDGLGDAAQYALNQTDPQTLLSILMPLLKSILGDKGNTTNTGGGGEGGGMGGRRLQASGMPGALSGIGAGQGVGVRAGRAGAGVAAGRKLLQPEGVSAAGRKLLQPEGVSAAGRKLLQPQGGAGGQAAQLAAMMMAAGMDPDTANKVAGLLTTLDDPASKAELIAMAAGDDPAAQQKLSDLLANGLPKDPYQLKQVLGVILAGPLGQGAGGGDGGGGAQGPPLTPDAVEAMLVQLVQEVLGVRDPAQAKAMVEVLLPLAVEVMKGSSTVDLADLVFMYQELIGMRQVVGNLVKRLRQPPVTLLFNASAFHSMMGAYTDIQQALANIDRGAAAARAAQVAAAGPGHVYDWQGNQYSQDVSTKDRTLRVTNHPLPLTANETLAIDTFLSILAAILCMIPFCYLAGAYCVSPVSEERTGARALQISSGCPRAVYWAGSMTWDVTMHLAVSLVSLATFAAFGDAATTGTLSQAFGTLLLILGFGVGCVPLSYCFSFGFSSPSSAQVFVSALNFLLGFMFVVASQTMQGIPECKEFQRVAVHFCRLLPPFNLGEGLISLSEYRLYVMLAQDLEPAKDPNRQNMDSIIPPDAIAARDVPSSPFAWRILGRNLTAMYGTAVLYFLLAVSIDALRSDPFLRTNLVKAARAAWQRVVEGAVRIGSRVRGRRYTPLAGSPNLEGGQGHISQPLGGLELQSGTISQSHAQKRTATLDNDDGTLDEAERGMGTSDSLLDNGPTVGAAGGQVGEVVDEDVDVAAERRRVAGPQEKFALSVQNLRKVYSTRPPKVAVAGLCLGVEPGQRFGFLGANGAGKSSTLRVLSGQSAPTAGDALVNGRSVITAAGAAASHQKLVGYCPQVDPLLELLTAREQVVLYASLKGVPDDHVQGQAEELLVRVGLPTHMWHRGSGTLSGGNKRKVALAIALVGQPALVLLDEPSSGMDPGARRMMWDAILRATQPHPTTTHHPATSTPRHGATARSGDDDEGSSLLSGAQTSSTGPVMGAAGEKGKGGSAAALLLTTHYLEEAEALCERVGIMSKGRLMCLGTPQHLKTRFGAAYAIELRCSTGAAQPPTPAPRPARAPSSSGVQPAPSTQTQDVLSGEGQALKQEYLVAELSASLPGLAVVEAAWGHIRAALPLGPNTPSMAAIFRVLERCKASPQMGLLAYSVAQPSLEAVFLRVCGHKLDEHGEYEVEE